MAMRTFTHLYDNYDDAVATVQGLEDGGVPHADISLVANNAEGRSTAASAASVNDADAESTGGGTGATVGTVLGGGAGLLAGLGMLAIPGVGPVVAAGWLIATLTGAGVGAAGGGFLGTLIGTGVPEEHAHTYAEGVRRGGTLVTVRADDSQAMRIEAILIGSTPVDVVARRTDYLAEGWTRHDSTAPAYSADQVTTERSRRVRVS